MKTQAVVFTEKDKIEIREVGLEPMTEDDILTETIYTFVSPGTELRTLDGHYGASKRFPLIPGYATVSRVVETGKNVVAFRPGDLLCTRSGGKFEGVVAHFGGQAGHHVYNMGDGHLLLPPDAAENPLKFAPVEVAAISNRGVDSTRPQPNELALVIGLGMIGFFEAELLRLKGCIVTVCDIAEQRVQAARERGFNAVVLDGPDAKERLIALSANSKYDIVAECSGSTAGFELAYSMLRDTLQKDANAAREALTWPRLLLQGNYVDDISLNPCWFFRGEGIIYLTPADRTLYDRKKVAEDIRSGKLDTTPFTQNVFTPAEMPAAYRKLQQREINSAVCKWSGI